MNGGRRKLVDAPAFKAAAERTGRKALRRLGVDVHRYPSGDGIGRSVALMRRYGVDLVVDVGASDGGYAQDLFDRGYSGRLVSFEPLLQPFGRLQRKARSNAQWQVVNAAVGECEGATTINVAGNNGESSSILPMLARHRDGDPTSAYVGTQQCDLVRLDQSLPRLLGDRLSPFMLKVDVQGRESQVFDGCANLVEAGLIYGLQVEMSFVPLYKDATTWEEVVRFVTSLDLELVFIRPGFSDAEFRLLQADGFFFRKA